MEDRGLGIGIGDGVLLPECRFNGKSHRHHHHPRRRRCRRVTLASTNATVACRWI